MLKYLTLYGLYSEKFEGKEKNKTFFEYIEKFLNEGDAHKTPED